MKKGILLSVLMICLGLSLHAKNIDGGMITKHNGISYEKNMSEPFTGNAYFFFKNGKTKKLFLTIKVS